jgi:type IV pilus assembly protein PilC
MVKAGINIRDAIDAVASQVKSARFREVLYQVSGDVESGQPLSKALGKHPGIFRPLYVNMIRAAELSGSLAGMLQRISVYLSSQMETRSMIRGAMVYPIILGVMAVVTTVFLLVFVLPQFTSLFAGKEALLPAPTLALMAISNFMRTRWYLVLAGGIAVVAGLTVGIKTPRGRITWDRLKLRLPVLRGLFHALYISRSVHTLSELLTAGVGILETLRITADVSGNTVYRNMWMTVHQAVEQGDKLAETLNETAILPKNVVQMTAAGEESGRLGEVLGDVAEYYQKELRSSIKTVTSMIEPLMIVIMGLVVGFIAMSIILPIFKMSSLMK